MILIRDRFDGKPAQHIKLPDLSDRLLRRMAMLGSRDALRELARRGD